MRVRTFSSSRRPLGNRLKSLLALPGADLSATASGPIDLAATDDAATAADLVRDFAGKLPVWLDLDGAPTQQNAKHNRRREKAGIQAANLVTVATRGLWEEIREMTYRVVLLPDPVAPPSPVSGKATPLIGPAVGYVGAADEPWQAEMVTDLARIARKLAVHIGGAAARHPAIIKAERALPNLHLHPDAGNELWRRLRAAVFPYVVDTPTHNWLPAPLLAAWSEGVPTVTTPLGEVMRLPTPVLTATTAAGMAGQIDALLATPDEAAEDGRALQAFVETEHQPAQLAARLRETLKGLENTI